MRLPRFAGTDLGPLPYESSPSCLLRFSERNAFNRKAIEKTLECFLPLPLRDSPGAMHGNVVISTEFGWNLPSDDEQAFYSSDPRYVLFVSGRFRYCQACLGCGYHSYLFQIKALETCPIHEEPLIEGCPHCGAHIDDYRDYFTVPYACPRCHAMLCSNPADRVQHHLHFRATIEQALPLLKAIHNWYIDTATARTTLRRMISRRDWINHRLLEAYFQLVTPRHPLMGTPNSPSSELLVMRWQREIVPPRTEAFDVSALNLTELHELHAATYPLLQVAKRIIFEWIDDLCANPDEDAQKRALIANRAAVALSNQWDDADRRVELMYFEFPHVPPYFFSFANNRSSWFYGILGLYSCLYANLAIENISLVRDVPCRFEMTDHHCVGEMILPYIEGLSERIAKTCKRAVIYRSCKPS